jgi:DNA-binding CsgD family transcriptional regulator
MGNSAVERFIEEANEAKSTQEVARLFGAALENYGFDRFCYSLITDHPSLGLAAGHGIVQNYPDDWMAHYNANNYQKKDPLPRYGFNTMRPFTWDSLEQTRELKPEEKKVMNEAREARLLDGVAVPICGTCGELAGVGMASSIGRIQPDAALLGKLHALVMQFHLVYTELEVKDRPPPPTCQVNLTAREREILQWAAEGKSDSVIAEILGVSHATIRFHMNNIFKKLNANERTLATVKAIRTGLILPSYVG